MSRRHLLAGWLLAQLFLFAPLAFGHFLFVVPESGGKRAAVILSETLSADPDVKPERLGKTVLTARQTNGRENPLALVPTKDAFAVDLTNATNLLLLHGELSFGVQQRGQGKPFLLSYHPKTIFADALNADSNRIGPSAIAEIVPTGTVGDVRFLVLVGGKPTSEIELNVLQPDGTNQKVKTNQDGLTTPLNQTGRFGLWARCIVPTAGEFEGKKYEEIRHYPTLVVDIGPAKSPLPETRPVTLLPATRPMVGDAELKLPEATSSFGAAVSDGWLYVYGGHIEKTHRYSTAAVSGKFHRVNLTHPDRWESLPPGPGLQGMNLAAHGGKIYRVGGMEPRNKPGDKADNYSVTTVARFDPASGKWDELPPMPEPRSSHDVAFVGDKLVVTGGWNMQGRNGEDEFSSTVAILDLSASPLAWKQVKQPFERRALIAAVHDGKVYVIGGFSDESKPSRQVDIYDVANDRWTMGPELPAPALNGFAPAACVVENRVYASVADGSLYRLDDSGKGWEKVAQTTPRIVHRLAVVGTKIFVLGGASKGANFDRIEVVDVASLRSQAVKH